MAKFGGGNKTGLRPTETPDLGAAATARKNFPGVKPEGGKRFKGDARAGGGKGGEEKGATTRGFGQGRGSDG